MKQISHIRTLLVLGVVILSGIFAAPVLAQDWGNDTTKATYGVLAIRHFNFDSFKDTLIGRIDRQYHFIPYTIRWGKGKADTTRNVDSLRDDSEALTPIADSLRVTQTRIYYPHWKNFTAKCAVFTVNEDSLSDIVVHMWGQIEDSSGTKDTLRSLVIFGQHGLDTLGDVDFDSVEITKSEPFFAMQLRTGIEYVSPSLRDPTGTVSYILNPIKLNVKRQKQKALEVSNPALSVAGVSIRVFPNPTATSTNVSMENVPVGQYTVEIVSVNGQRVFQQGLTLSKQGRAEESIHLDEVPSGYFFLRLLSNRQVIASYPLIIVR